MFINVGICDITLMKGIILFIRRNSKMKYIENNKTIEKELEEKIKSKELSNEQWQ